MDLTKESKSFAQWQLSNSIYHIHRAQFSAPLEYPNRNENQNF